MDSRQGGLDGVSTDGILTEALTTGILQRARVAWRQRERADGLNS